MVVRSLLRTAREIGNRSRLCELLDDKEACTAYGEMAQKKELSEKSQLTELLNLMENERE